MQKMVLNLAFIIFAVFSSEAFCGHGHSKEEGANQENSSLNRTFSQRSLFKMKESPERSRSATQLKRTGSSRQISIYSDLPKAINSLYQDATDINPNWPYIKQKMNEVELRLKELEDYDSSRYRDSMSNEQISGVKSQLEFLREKVKDI